VDEPDALVPDTHDGEEPGDDDRESALSA
jgi:hypothetical protein